MASYASNTSLISGISMMAISNNKIAYNVENYLKLNEQLQTINDIVIYNKTYAMF